MAQLPSVEQLLEAGVHFGHKTNKWNPKMSEYIYTQRNGIHIIDLSQTLSLLEKALKELSLQAKSSEILIVGTKRQARSIVQDFSEKVGIHYIINRWPGGLLTNFKMHAKSIKKLLDLEEELAGGVENRTKQEIVWMKREKDKLERLFGGVRFMRNLPSIIVIVDPKSERIAVKEAKNMHTKTIGIVDTNCDPDSVTYPIPANDDALKSLELLISVIAGTISHAQGPSVSITSLRRSHEAKLQKLEQDSKIKAELRRKDEEMKQQELKALKEGKKVTVVEEKGGVKVVRAESTEADAPKTVTIPKEAAPKVVKKAEKKPKKVNPKDTELAKLKLAARTLTSLVAANITTKEELKKLADEDILKVPGIGQKALDEIKKAL
jgi:small subunit ribosomal protein S2